jgi:hypothetical protein
MTKAEKLQKAKDSVVREAVAWVNFDDDGLIPSLYKDVRIRTRLVNAVERYERAKNLLSRQ